MKIITLMRTNWKKSIIGVGLGAYACNYGREMYQISSLLKSYSKEAAIYGDEFVARPRNLTVILNPAANKKKSEKTFMKYCEPILHLAGFTVNIIRTDSEGYAKIFVEQLKTLPDGIVVAGGDGSVCEVLTGLMRRNADTCPIGLLPLGSKNETTKKVLNLTWSSKIDEVETLLKASLNIARNNLKVQNVFKIEQTAKPNTEQPVTRPIYSIGFLEWGIHRDIKSLQEKYWYFWKADSFMSALLNSFNSKLSWMCKADVSYTTPCNGCSNCIVSKTNSQNLSQKSILSRFYPRKHVAIESDTIQSSSNLDCGKEYNQYVNASNVRIYVDEARENNNLLLETEENLNRGFDYFSKYINKVKETKLIKFRTISLFPDESCIGDSKLYSIDNEAYDVRPIKVTLIPKAVEIFT